MCQQPDTNLIFCTCENDISQAETIDITWTLYRCVDEILKSEDEFSMLKIVGMARISDEIVGNGLHSNDVLYALNQTTPFDFEYNPKTGDLLELADNSSPYKGKMFFRYDTDTSSWVMSEGFLANSIYMTNGKLYQLSEQSNNSKSNFKEAWREQELIGRAKEYIKSEDRLVQQQDSVFTYLLKLIGIKKKN